MPTRSEIQDILAASQENVMTDFEGLSPEALECPCTASGVPGEVSWRAKDHFAHLTANEQNIQTLLRLTLFGGSLPDNLASMSAEERLAWSNQRNQTYVNAHRNDRMETLRTHLSTAHQETLDLLIANYPGDFLASLLKKYPSEFRSWQGRSSWVRKPYTHYRDCYLDALWYAAEYEWRLGQRSIDTGNAETQEAIQRQQQEHFGRAAQNYQSYAMYACNSKFDAKATFGAHGEFGERIGMSERALRRCVVLLGAIGKTDLVNQVWSAYHTQMKSISDQRWQPSKETQADVEAARSQTSAYRFAAQVSQTSSEFAERQQLGGQ
jgi:hypothetical protein